MDILTLILRVVHIFAGVFWAGTTFSFVSFLQPTIVATGPEGQKVIQHLTQRTRFSQALAWAATLSVISGVWLYLRIFGGISLSGGYGLGLTLGGLAGILAAGLGIGISRRATVQLGDLGKQIAASGGPPTPAQMSEIQALQERLSNGARWAAILLALAVLGMASAQALIG